jgi:histidyl-tRNA synthetase
MKLKSEEAAEQSEIKELISYYKKNMSSLPAIDRERLKTNPLRILDSKEEKTIELNQGAPDTLSHLCPSCKKHFKEVLEYLEQMEIPYNINKCLVRGLSYYTRTVIEIIQEDPETGKKMTITAGGRYDYLSKQLGNKKDAPAVGISIGVDRVVESPWFSKLTPRIIKKPKIYFIQLGFDAKLKSLNVIEILRKGKIPIAQSLSKDNLGAQLAIAEKLGMEYTIIFGQKEALENSVIVRDMSNRSQETIKLTKLLEYLKNIK